jgi:hypothetical protein
MYERQILQRRMPKESLADAQSNTFRRATRWGAFQGSTGQGGLSHLLPTNAEEIDMLCFTSTRDDIVCTDLRLCENK